MTRRSNNTCRFCGDTALMSEDWQPTGLCSAHSAETVKAAQKATRAAYRADRESVAVKPRETGNGNRCVQTYRGEVWVNDEGEPI